MSEYWQGRTALVTGGAAFIGSHLVDALVARGAKVRVVDNLSSGHLDNLRDHLDAGRIEFQEADLLDPAAARRAVAGIRPSSTSPPTTAGGATSTCIRWSVPRT